ncbi:hypothetical protein ACLX1H_006818 [Fusarium chlamydosporum]
MGSHSQPDDSSKATVDKRPVPFVARALFPLNVRGKSKNYISAVPVGGFVLAVESGALDDLTLGTKAWVFTLGVFAALDMILNPFGASGTLAQLNIMKPIVAYVTVFVILSTFITNAPMEDLVTALMSSHCVGNYSLSEGASLLANILVSLKEKFWELHDLQEPLKPYLGPWHRETGHESAEFDAMDRFYHSYGICCGERGHCISCLKQQAEQFRENCNGAGHEFDRQLKQALTE